MASRAPVGRVRKTAAEKKAALIQKLIQSIEAKLDSEQIKGSVGDLIRLLQIQKELEDEQPKEITVTWVDRKTDGDGTDK